MSAALTTENIALLLLRAFASVEDVFTELLPSNELFRLSAALNTHERLSDPV
jgi:hypothetical protein